MTFRGSKSGFLRKTQIGPLTLEIHPRMVSSVTITNLSIIKHHQGLLGSTSQFSYKVQTGSFALKMQQGAFFWYQSHEFQLKTRYPGLLRYHKSISVKSDLL